MPPRVSSDIFNNGDRKIKQLRGCSRSLNFELREMVRANQLERVVCLNLKYENVRTVREGLFSRFRVGHFKLIEPFSSGKVHCVYVPVAVTGCCGNQDELGVFKLWNKERRIRSILHKM